MAKSVRFKDLEGGKKFRPVSGLLSRSKFLKLEEAYTLDSGKKINSVCLITASLGQIEDDRLVKECLF